MAAGLIFLAREERHEAQAMGNIAEDSMIELAGGTNLLVKESLARKLAELKTQLAGPQTLRRGGPEQVEQFHFLAAVEATAARNAQASLDT